MRRIFTSALIVGLGLGLAGCGETTKVEEKTTAEGPGGSTTTTTTQETKTTGDNPPAATTTEPPAAKQADRHPQRDSRRPPTHLGGRLALADS